VHPPSTRPPSRPGTLLHLPPCVCPPLPIEGYPGSPTSIHTQGPCLTPAPLAPPDASPPLPTVEDTAPCTTTTVPQPLHPPVAPRLLRLHSMTVLQSVHPPCNPLLPPPPAHHRPFDPPLSLCHRLPPPPSTSSCPPLPFFKPGVPITHLAPLNSILLVMGSSL
jgi:hypothetical protein